MEFLVVILVIALIATVAYIVMQRRPGGAGRFGRRTGPVVRRPRGAEEHPMANAVVDHIEATGPQEVVAAEQRLRARARQVAAPIQAEHDRREQERVADQVGEPDAYAEPDPYVEPRDDSRR